jgi:dienelactone hydrolase
VSAAAGDTTIEPVAGQRYEPFGWNHWPDHPWWSYQLRRALGQAQAGGGAISECFQAASRMVPGDPESWHREWLRVAERNRTRGDKAEAAGSVLTARACWLRAANYYRLAEYWLSHDDPRALATFELCESAFRDAGRYFSPAIEAVHVPYERDMHLSAYFVRAQAAPERSPVLICFGGLDSVKEELLFMVARGALDRGISCLLVDGPGQGVALRRQELPARHDYEVPVGRCIDYLEGRVDVDPNRIAVGGSGLGGYYAARAGAYEHRLAAVVSHGPVWHLNDFLADREAEREVADHVNWVFGVDSPEALRAAAAPFQLGGVLERMRCPFLIVQGGHDVLGVKHATTAYQYALAHGLDVELVLVSEEETGAEHCQHDNPTVGMEYVGDGLARRLGLEPG